MRNPVWREDEIVLALDLFHELPSSHISAANPKIQALSDQLRALSPVNALNATYRNPNGVALKLHNLARFDSTRTARGMSRGGKLEEKVWARFNGKRTFLREEAARIREHAKQG
ncbi:hypothetical protein [Terriglobus sp. RCC_193]|uniref:hypothetical protein n=1 Tax=Terriglobus sp. RCC_193 TaxID=3239218 RepID=UPI003524B202